MPDTLLPFEDYLRLPLQERLPNYSKEGRLFHVMVAQQFDEPLLDRLFRDADLVKGLMRRPNGIDYLKSQLRHRRTMLYFTQPSTRTFLSFLTASQLVGMDTGEVRDAALSSEYKGESQEDGVRVFSSYFDAIVMRDPKPGFCEYMAYLLERTGRSVPILNGGSGKDQHPTQALLDLYTMHRSFKERGGMRGKRYAFVGDLLRGRAVRSAVYLLSQFSDIELFFVAPDAFQIAPDIEAHLNALNIPIHKSDRIAEVLPEVDCVYMTRVQDEYDLSGESSLIDSSSYSLNLKNVQTMRPDAIILHPLPRRDEIHPEVDSDPRAMYWRQLRNGVYIRAALMLHVFGRSHKLAEY